MFETFNVQKISQKACTFLVRYVILPLLFFLFIALLIVSNCASQVVDSAKRRKEWDATFKEANLMHEALCHNKTHDKESIFGLFKDLIFFESICFVVEADQTMCGLNLSKDAINDELTFGDNFIQNLPLAFWGWNLTNAPKACREICSRIQNIYMPEYDRYAL